MIFFFKQKTAYEMRISDWSSDVCSSDLLMRSGFLMLAATALASLAATAAPGQASERGSAAQVGKSAIGPEDQLGRLSMMTAESRAQILSRADGMRLYDLAQNLCPGMPRFTEAGDPPFQVGTTKSERRGAGKE